MPFPPTSGMCACDAFRPPVREPVPSWLHGGMATVRPRVLTIVILALALAACTSSKTFAPTITTGPPRAEPLLAVDLSGLPPV